MNESLIDVLADRALHKTDKVAFTFLARGEEEEDALTYGELDRRAREIALKLRESAKPGDRALLAFPAGLDFIAAFFGCLYAQVIAVPVYVPQINSGLDRILSIVRDSGVTIALTTTKEYRKRQTMFSSFPVLQSLRWMEIENTLHKSHDNTAAANYQPAPVDASALAFLQYTSGSTATPKGVMVRHGNVVHNTEVIRRFCGLSEQTICISWLPVYHDMGLIGNVLTTVYVGGSAFLMSPASFIQQPIRWLKAVSRYRGTLSGAPNFAYDLCVRKVPDERKKELDLSSWVFAYNGAEPVRAETLERFSEAFASCGFRKEALCPTYGLAEATLMVSCPGGSDKPRLQAKTFDAGLLEQGWAAEVSNPTGKQRTLVSHGCGPSDQKTVIVDPESFKACPSGQLGEIWISSPSVAAGYWNNPEETNRIFQGRLAESIERPFLRTGDLGFLHEGELYIAGRLKDLIIINGRNHHPQDIELTVQNSQTGLTPGSGAAFSIDVEGEEKLVVVQEIQRSHARKLDVAEAAKAVREAIALQHEVEVHRVEFVSPGAIPKTSSGKIQRKLCRKMFLTGELRSLGRRRPAKSPQPAVFANASEDPPMQFSLFYFSSNEAEFREDKYKLLLEGAKFADEHGLTSVWIPERHFHAFGGLYPNPSVLASALAMITKNIRIRAGSVVLPLHNPIRVAEEWSIVDNLSNGRVDLAFARGWNANDFVLSPSNYSESLIALYRELETVCALWQGKPISVPNGKGQETEIKIYPLPRQRELPIWITCSGGLERFTEAGAGGWNVLTALLFQSIDELGEKVAAYREARLKHGHDPATGQVTAMLHTFLGKDEQAVRTKVRPAFVEYLRTSVDLWRHGSKDLNDLSAHEREEVLNFAFERYYHSNALFGTPETCYETVQKLKRAGVNEIACLIDFGVDVESVLESLHYLALLKQMSGRSSRENSTSDEGRKVLAATSTDPSTITTKGEKSNGHVLTSPQPEPVPLAAQSMNCNSDHADEEAAPEQTLAGELSINDNRTLLRWCKTIISEELAEVTGTSRDTVDPDKNFLSLGISSLKAIEIVGRLEEIFELKLSSTQLFEFPTIAQFAAELVRQHAVALNSKMMMKHASETRSTRAERNHANTGLPPAAASSHGRATQDSVAIIGMACRFPGAPDLASYWKLLVEAGNAVTEVPADHWDWRDYYDSNPEAEKKTYSRWGGFLKNLDLFDSTFFNISPRESKLIDPQQRIFLEIAWETFEHSGYSPESLGGQQVGVFAGASYNGYYQRIVPGLKQSDHSAGVGNQNAIIPNRVSFFLNLHGPSVLVDTLCSSSLVAIHLACQSLRNGECSLALAGGVNVLLSPENYIAMSRMKAHAVDGRCKAFDHRANGIVFGEGAGAVLLKPLQRALQDGDTVYAVIRGSAMNHGGQANGLLAPNPAAQAQVIREAIKAAGISAESITYVEAHGTGTSLGDPIEIDGLTKAFRHDTDRRQFCRLGSVKTNIGHLESAAGIAGLIKVVLAMQHQQLPPIVHFEKPNPLISFETSPFAINAELSPWNSDGPRRAGVSSFGIGGTNAHVVLEEPPVQCATRKGRGRSDCLFTLSAKTETALRTSAERYSQLLTENQDIDLHDLCFTASAGRSHFDHRLGIIAGSKSALQSKLQSFISRISADGVYTGNVSHRERPGIAFLFTGQGSQYAGMGSQLYRSEPVFRKAMDRCSEIVQPWLHQPLTSILFSKDAESRLQTDAVFAQTALFALETSLAELWKSWGIVPDMVMGHSLGEYAAAHVASVFTLEEGLQLIAERTRLLQAHVTERGAMAVVFEDSRIVLEQLSRWTEHLAVAAFNGPRNAVISGAESHVKNMVAELEKKGVVCELLKVTHAFHSPLLNPMLEQFERTVRRFTFRAPQIPVVSNLTGRCFDPGFIPDAVYWRRHMREPVQFAQGVTTLIEHGCNMLIEVGPSSALLSIIKRCPGAESVVGVPSLLAGKEDGPTLLNSMARLYVHGVSPDLTALYRDDAPRRIALPTYPFERRRAWMEGTAGGQETMSRNGVAQTNSQDPNTAKLPKISSMEKGAKTTEKTRKDAILKLMRNSLSRFLEMDEREIDNYKSLLEMGSDSLVFIEAIQAIQQIFAVKITIRQLFQELTTLDVLADYIDAQMAHEATFEGWSVLSSQPAEITTIQGINGATLEPAPDEVPSAISSPKTVTGVPSSSPERSLLERVIEQQLVTMNQMMQKQLEMVRESSWGGMAPVPSPEKSQAGQTEPLPKPGDPTVRTKSLSAASRVDATLANAQPWVPYQSWNPGSLDELTPAQQEYLQGFIAKYTERTSRSKKRTQEHRAHHADLRAAMSFRLCTKEIRYPIIGIRSSGSTLWDVDGNRYVDFTMGYGVNLFGHNPPFVMKALKEQMEKGVHVGPQSELAGEVAHLICKMTGMERATFCNTGTEAVMAALRVARTTTGRNKIAIFAGSYHGTSDGVLVSAQMEDGALVAAPMVPGIPQGMVQDLVVLNYGSTRSLDLLKGNINQFAAVLVEPVQSRKPDLQPREFLHQLRKITEEAGVALIFDETITGFRVAQGGAQSWFGIKADLATYGKVIGGGMPIGVLAGRPEYMDSIDGGVWRFGDLSVPQAKTTLYTGTFCKHPLAMAAARATLLEIERRGPALFEHLNSQTQQLAQSLNDIFRKAEVPIEAVHFGSLFRLGGGLQLVAADSLDLLFYHLIHHGIYVWEGRNWFLSTAHTSEELENLVRVMESCVAEMQQADFLPRSVGQARRTGPTPDIAEGNPGGKSQEGGEPRTQPNSDAQKNLFLLCQADKAASLACNQSACLRLAGNFQFDAFEYALERVMQRHNALRTVFSGDAMYQHLLPSAKIKINRKELSVNSVSEQQAHEVSEWLEDESQLPFDLTEGPLWRVALLTINQQEVLLAITVHHLIADGWSIGVLLHEIGFYYSQKVQGQSNELMEPLQFSDYDNFLKQELAQAKMAAAENYWVTRLKDVPAPHLLFKRARSHGHRGDRIHLELDAALMAELRNMSSHLGASLFMVLLSAYQFHLCQLTGQYDLVVVIPVAGQSQMNNMRLIGDCSNLMPLRTKLSPEMTFTDCVETVKRNLLETEPYQLYPLARLIEKLGTSFDPSRWPFFNIDRPLASVRFFGTDAKPVPLPSHHTNFDLGVNVTLVEDADVTFDFKRDVFQKEEVEAWSKGFRELLRQITANPKLKLASLPSHLQQVQEPIPEALEQLAYVAPRSQVEEILASMWEQVLCLPKVSVTANFFDLGGHSLLATQIISRVRDAFEVQLTLEPLFQDPTVAGLAAVVERAIQIGKDPKEHSLTAGPRTGLLPLSFSQRRLWLIDQLDTQNTAYNMIGAARLLGALKIMALEKAFTEVIRRHESLRTVFRSTDGEPVQEILPPYALHLEPIKLTNTAEEERQDVIVARGQEMARSRFDLTKGPLINVSLLQFGEEEHAVIIIVHHIVSDGWSMGMLLKEVLLLYDAFSSGKPSLFPELPVQFADYALWQRKWLQGEALEQQLGHWLSLLKGVPSFLSLPTDRPRLTTPSFKGAHEQFTCTQKSTELLRQLCRQQGVTPFMVLLSIFSLLLSRYSGQEDFVIGTDIANRNRSEIEDLIGCFVNLLPLRLNLAGNPSFREYLQKVKKLTLDAYVHQNVPFDLLIRALRPERKLTTTPLVQVLFVLQNTPLPVTDVQGLKAEIVPVPMETAEFELILSIDDTSGTFIGTLGYSTDLFDRERIQSMISHFKTLIDQVVSNPDGKLSAFSVLQENSKKAYAASAQGGLSQKDLDTLFLRLGSTSED